MRSQDETPPGPVAIAGDVTDSWHRVALADAAGDGLELLVNNASTLGASPLPALAEIPLRTLTEVFAVNAIAPLALVQLALAHLPAGGRIVNVTSDAAVEAYEGWGGYGASKAALEQLSAVLAAETARPARLRPRSRRHEQAHAPRRLPRRGHLRPPAAARQRSRPARPRRRRATELALSRQWHEFGDVHLILR